MKTKDVYVVAGVSGSGKSTIGRLLADKLNIPFEDADAYHSKANKAKMAAGHALNDQDRQPWLETLAAKLDEWSTGEGAVLACSALKEAYRKTLETKTPVTWIFLEGSYALLKSRLSARKNHFFDPKLLQSQLDTLELPDYGIHVSIKPEPDAIVTAILQKLNQ